MKEMVNHPDHYNAHPSGVECIDIIEWMSLNVGNAVKYLWRVGLKGPTIEELRKAEWYIRREIERMEKLEKNESTSDNGGEVPQHVQHRDIGQTEHRIKRDPATEDRPYC